MANEGGWLIGKIGRVGGMESGRLVRHGALNALIHGLCHAVEEVEHDLAGVPGGFEVGLGYQLLPSYQHHSRQQ
jgi:hypothetical protein